MLSPLSTTRWLRCNIRGPKWWPFSPPAAFALAILTAAWLGYHPQFVASSVAASPSTRAGLIGSFPKGKAGAVLLSGIITASYLPSTADLTNTWVALFYKIYENSDATEPFDANTIYVTSYAYSTYQLLLANGDPSPAKAS